MPWAKYDPSQFSKYHQGQKQQESQIKTACVRVTGGTTADCVNKPVTITSLRTGAIAKIPVVLAELTLQLNLDAIIDLPEPAIEIKDMKKHVKVVQCLLLQDTNMLFIKGFVRKNIDYTTRSCSNIKGICGDLRHCTVDIPFNCTTPVTFNGIDPLPSVSRTATEFEYFRKQNISGPGFAEKDELLSGDLSEFNQISTEYFNELPYCELVSSKIIEFDEYLNPIRLSSISAPFEEKQFRSIEEKMVIFLTLKILQNRQVAIPAVAIGPVDGEQC
ncbi:CsxC family protein [Thermotalea metallivorans]|uniref:SipL SPOCS domain-containing protein n=1 Tax=Thermotalea metallivorans TaxID=520762 RepID=A0A140L6E5_9FIRM|nr:hypothetical protein [Thermotalea metallivorans]KXG76120.1 hypothetical protein AN619_10770 [Thermotalea metallivorans]